MDVHVVIRSNFTIVDDTYASEVIINPEGHRYGFCCARHYKRDRCNQIGTCRRHHFPIRILQCQAIWDLLIYLDARCHNGALIRYLKFKGYQVTRLVGAITDHILVQSEVKGRLYNKQHFILIIFLWVIVIWRGVLIIGPGEIVKTQYFR